MPRSTSPTLDSLLFDCETQSTVDITLRDGSTKYFCTSDPEFAAYLSAISGHTYSSDLMRVGELKETLGQATNNVQVIVSNVNKLFGLNVAAPSRKTELADVVIRRFYRHETNHAVYEWTHFFTGKAVNSVIQQQWGRSARSGKEPAVRGGADGDRRARRKIRADGLKSTRSVSWGSRRLATVETARREDALGSGL